MAFTPDPNLVQEHRQWLSAFNPQYLHNWEKLLNADAEAAMCEATYRRILEQNGCTVEPNETLDGSGRRPDFRCKLGDRLFYVEVTCISIQKAAEETGIPADEAQITRSFSTDLRQGLTDAVWGAAKAKAPQVANLDAPSVLAVGTFHPRASIICLSDHDVARCLTGHWQMYVNTDPQTGALTNDLTVETSLESASFIRRDDQELAVARRSISAIVIGGFGSGAPNVKGLIHPRPARPFDRSLLPTIRFCRLGAGYESGSLPTEWI